MTRRGSDCGFATIVAEGLAMMSRAGSPSSPSGPPGSLTDENSVTVGASGVSPRILEIRVGERVAFTSNDTVNHEMSSDGHPSHLDRPAIN